MNSLRMIDHPSDLFHFAYQRLNDMQPRQRVSTKFAKKAASVIRAVRLSKKVPDLIDWSEILRELRLKSRDKGKTELSLHTMIFLGEFCEHLMAESIDKVDRLTAVQMLAGHFPSDYTPIRFKRSGKQWFIASNVVSEEGYHRRFKVKLKSPPYRT